MHGTAFRTNLNFLFPRQQSYCIKFVRYEFVHLYFPRHKLCVNPCTVAFAINSHIAVLFLISVRYTLLKSVQNPIHMNKIPLN